MREPALRPCRLLTALKRTGNDGWIDTQYDAAIYIANWPAKRAHHWKPLLPARTVENQCYVIGVNRTEQDGNGLAYSGDWSIIDPVGNILFQQTDIPYIHTGKLNYDRIREYRETFATWQNAGGYAVLRPR